MSSSHSPDSYSQENWSCWPNISNTNIQIQLTYIPNVYICIGNIYMAWKHTTQQCFTKSNIDQPDMRPLTKSLNFKVGIKIYLGSALQPNLKWRCFTKADLQSQHLPGRRLFGIWDWVRFPPFVVWGRQGDTFGQEGSQISVCNYFTDEIRMLNAWWNYETFVKQAVILTLAITV